MSHEWAVNRDCGDEGLRCSACGVTEAELAATDDGLSMDLRAIERAGWMRGWRP